MIRKRIRSGPGDDVSGKQQQPRQDEEMYDEVVLLGESDIDDDGNNLL